MPHPLTNFQAYRKSSAGSLGFPVRIWLRVPESAHLETAQLSEDLDSKNASQILKPDQVSHLSPKASKPSGPLTNLLYRLNDSPSDKLLPRVAEADRVYEPRERVTSIGSSLRKVLISRQILHKLFTWPCGSVEHFFSAFSTKPFYLEEDLDNGDEHKTCPDHDPEQEPDVYEYSSDEKLELQDPFALERSVLTRFQTPVTSS